MTALLDFSRLAVSSSILLLSPESLLGLEHKTMDGQA